MGRRTSASLEATILDLFERRCAICHVGVVGSAMDIDHVLAWNDGGVTEIENLWPLCPNCHAHKHRTISKLCGPWYFVAMRRLWSWWFAEKATWVGIDKSQRLDYVASRLRNELMLQFVAKCTAYKTVAESLKWILDQHEVTRTRQSVGYCRPAARIALSIGILRDRCYQLSKARNALQLCERLCDIAAVAADDPLRRELAIAIDHLNLKRPRRTAGGFERCHTAMVTLGSVQNHLQHAYWSREIDTAVWIYDKYVTAMSPSDRCQATETLAATLLHGRSREFVERAAILDEESLRLAITSGNQRTILLRLINVCRSAMRNQNWQLAAESCILAAEWSHGAVGLGPHAVWCLIRDGLSAGPTELKNALRTVESRAGVGARFQKLRSVFAESAAGKVCSTN